MNTQPNTVEKILTEFNGLVTTGSTDAGKWCDLAWKLNNLIAQEHDTLLELQQVVSNMKMILHEKGESGVRVKAKVEATDEYKEMKRQERKIEQITEYIRISKLQGRLKNDEMRGY